MISITRTATTDNIIMKGPPIKLGNIAVAIEASAERAYMLALMSKPPGANFSLFFFVLEKIS